MDKTLLTNFISPHQMSVLNYMLESEEKEYFKGMLTESSARIKAMPVTGETDGQGDLAIVYLHYFCGSSDWWITEKDPLDKRQNQAFGYACLNDPDCAELGYISLPELWTIDAELDLYWTPVTLNEIKQQIYRS